MIVDTEEYFEESPRKDIGQEGYRVPPHAQPRLGIRGTSIPRYEADWFYNSKSGVGDSCFPNRAHECRRTLISRKELLHRFVFQLAGTNT